MDGVQLIEPTDLYNLLQQATVYSCLSDAKHVLLIDARKTSEYNESHIVTAKKVAKTEDGQFLVPNDSELECKTNVIVYDSNTSTLKDDSLALECSKMLWDMRSRNAVKILKGGYEEFSALYPYLRTQKVMFMPRELDEIKPYPTEIIPGFLYLGNWKQGNAAYIQKDLKIKAHINCCVEAEKFFEDAGPHLLHIQVEDTNEADILCKFKTACAFLDTNKDAGKTVLVFSFHGISRSPVVIMAYLMQYYKWTVKEAYQHVLRCCPSIRPNRGFVEQLSSWEEEIHGQKLTDIEDPNF